MPNFTNNNEQHSTEKFIKLKADPTDVVLIVEDEEFPAHRSVLSALSEVFAAQLQGDFKESRELKSTIVAPKDAFKILLDYAYSKTLDLSRFKIADVIDLLELAHRFNITNLEEDIVQYLCTTVEPADTSMTLEMALLLDIPKLEDICWFHVELIVEGIIKEDLDLSRSVLLQFLKRKPRMVSEIKLFQFVYKLFPDEIDDEIVSSINFAAMTPAQLIDIVKPTKVLSDSQYLDIMEEISICNACPLLKTNRGSISESCTVDCVNPKHLFATLRNKWAVAKNKAICIDLDRPYIINHIQFQLRETSEKYYVEVSRDGQSWKMLIDFSESYLQGCQMLFFCDTIVKGIRIVGTKNVALEISSFKLFYYFEGPPPSLGGRTLPPSNILLKSHVRLGNYSFAKRPYPYESTFFSHEFSEGSFIVNLFQPYLFRSCCIRFGDHDKIIEHTLKVTLLSTYPPNKKPYSKDIVYDSGDTPVRGLLPIKFSLRFVDRIIIQSTAISDEHLPIYFEASVNNNLNSLKFKLK